MNLNRRGFFVGLAAALAAPAVASAASLMPLRGVRLIAPALRLVSETRGIDIACPDDVLAGLDAANPPDLLRHMALMTLRAPRIDNHYAPDLRFEATNRVTQYMQIQAIRMSNVLLALVDHAVYRAPVMFRGIPVEVVT